MKLTHVLAPARFGGLESVVYALATGQRRRRHEVQVVMLLEPGVAEPLLAPQLQDRGVTVASIVTPGRAYWTQLRLLREHCVGVGPDIIHTHGYLPDVLSWMLMRTFPARRVSTVHGFIGGTRRSRMYEWLQCRAYRSIDAVAVSRKLASDLARRGVPEAKVHVIANAAVPAEDPLNAEIARERLGVGGEAFSIGWVGRVSHEKGLDVLLEAVKELTDLSIRLTIIGDGPERRDLEALSSVGEMRSMVSWAGIVPDASRGMAAFDLLVISSRTEGTPMVLLEAMGASVPVVATAVGGIPDVITADHGILVPPEDPSALAAAIRSVYVDRTAAARRAEAARKRLTTEFSVDAWLDKYDRVYDSLPARSGEAVR
jgi:glycosyltransferase involved in cell wall biosynthesis